MIDSNRLIRGENASSMMLAKMGMRYGEVGAVWEWCRCLPGLVRCRAPSARLGSCSTRIRSAAGARTDFEHSLGLHWIVPAVAPRVAPEHAPHREHDAPEYAVGADRVDRIARARRLVLAAPGQRRRDRPLVDDDRSDGERRADTREAVRASSRGAGVGDIMRSRSSSSAAAAAPDPPRSRSRARSISSPSAASTPARPSRSASSRDSGRATTTTSCPRPSSCSVLRQRLAQQPLDPVALNRARQPCATPTARAAAAAWRVREGVEHEMAVGDRAALPVDALELGAARQTPSAGRRARPHRTLGPVARRARHRRHLLGGQARAALVAAALERRAVPRACACGRETRGCGRACASLVGRCASSPSFSVERHVFLATLGSARDTGGDDGSALKYRTARHAAPRGVFSPIAGTADRRERGLGYSRRTGPPAGPPAVLRCSDRIFSRGGAG